MAKPDKPSDYGAKEVHTPFNCRGCGGNKWMLITKETSRQVTSTTSASGFRTIKSKWEVLSCIACGRKLR